MSASRRRQSRASRSRTGDRVASAPTSRDSTAAQHHRLQVIADLESGRRRWCRYRRRRRIVRGRSDRAGRRRRCDGGRSGRCHGSHGHGRRCGGARLRVGSIIQRTVVQLMVVVRGVLLLLLLLVVLLLQMRRQDARAHGQGRRGWGQRCGDGRGSAGAGHRRRRRGSGRSGDGRCGAALWPTLVELDLVHRPDGALDVLHAHEALVQRQIVTHRVLPRWTPSAEVVVKHVGVSVWLRDSRKRGCWWIAVDVVDVGRLMIEMWRLNINGWCFLERTRVNAPSIAHTLARLQSHSFADPFSPPSPLPHIW